MKIIGALLIIIALLVIAFMTGLASSDAFYECERHAIIEKNR